MTENGTGKRTPNRGSCAIVVRETAACQGDSMGQWKPLADELEPAMRRLVVRLRELKDQMGVSTTTLANKTAYSRSSWERYLNGRALPPRQAVEAMGRVSGTDMAQLLALWELAKHARTQEQQVGVPSHEERRPRRWRPVVIAVVAAATLAVLAVAGWMTARDDSSSAPSGKQQTLAAVQPSGFACRYARRNGRLLAGHSATDPLVVLNAGGEQVVEVQCLLAYHKHSPGRIDGLFGAHTEKAVKELQRAGGAAVDGKVGPQTWALLRA
ncbi:peptidoglycan-binding protein [Streptomyces sp. NPDC007896]|uniref:peptidoglycan-binding protein n=2 Tax=Streptomyces TaxID=1883 RepID=UPI0036F03BE5